MKAILAYGSLVHPEEIAKKEIICAFPVRISGFKRLFNQLPSWRKGEGKRIGVLNIEVAPQEAINAVCLCFAADLPDALESRERGYDGIPVDAAQITCYPGYTLPEDLECSIYRGKSAMQRTDLLPNDAYLSRCIAGAARWGASFHAEFIQTTYLADGSALSEYLTLRG